MFSKLKQWRKNETIKLNMGCAHNKERGYINVDIAAKCNPDVVCDLEKFPWPWKTSSVDVVRFNHCLEHIGQDSDTFLHVMKELYRICKNDAEVEINVPHPRHDNFIGDPTHVRPITPQMLKLFDKQLNIKWMNEGNGITTLAIYLDVDFFITEAISILEEPYDHMFQEGKISIEELTVLEKERNNIVNEYRIKLKVRK